MDIYINDDRGQYIEGIYFQPGKNTVSAEEWKRIEQTAWVGHLIENGLLSIAQPAAILTEPLPAAEIKEEPTPIKAKRTVKKED